VEGKCFALTQPRSMQQGCMCGMSTSTHPEVMHVVLRDGRQQLLDQHHDFIALQQPFACRGSRTIRKSGRELGASSTAQAAASRSGGSSLQARQSTLQPSTHLQFPALVLVQCFEKVGELDLGGGGREEGGGRRGVA